jgi:hypothetical protein
LAEESVIRAWCRSRRSILDELFEALSAGRDSKLLEFSREVQLDGGLDLLRRESLAFPEDHEVARFAHDLQEQLSEDVVDQSDALLRDTELWLDLFQNSIDVGLKRSSIEYLNVLLAA